MNDELYQDLCDEFGAEKTAIARRELTAKNGKIPNYIELLALLLRKEGPGEAING